MINDASKKPEELSRIVNVVGAKGVPVNAIVLRGYLGRSDVVDRLLDVIRPSGPPPQASSAWADFATVANIVSPGGHLRDAVPWRLYLTPLLDRYVEFDWEDVLAWERESDVLSIDPATHAELKKSERDDSVTIWLRTRNDQGVEIGYLTVETAPLRSASGYVRGDLIEDYLRRPESGGVVWNEQDYGPFTGKSTGLRCIG